MSKPTSKPLSAFQPHHGLASIQTTSKSIPSLYRDIDIDMVGPSVPQVPQWSQTATDFKGLDSVARAMAAAQYSSRPYPENFTADPKLAAVCETVHATHRDNSTDNK
jgi:hypothetical protein